MINKHLLARTKVENLRKKGLSLNEISRESGVSKSTVSLWCRGIELSPNQKSILKEKQKRESTNALRKYINKARKKKTERNLLYRNLGRMDVGKISARDRFIAGAALYWGEGYKKGRGEVGFTNSDPRIIKNILLWFKETYSIKEEDFIARVSINEEHRSRIEKVLAYWRDVTKLPSSQFTKTSLIKSTSKKAYPNSDEHFGTLRIKVRRGTNLKERILGTLDVLGKTK